MQLANRIAQASLFLLCPLWVLPGQVSATPPVSVFVADATSGAPLPQTRVEFPALGLSQHTDSFGTAYFPRVKSGVARIKVSKIGYVPIEQDVTLEVPSANAIELSVTMRNLEVAQALDTVKVIGKATYFDLLSGFERRRRLGLGKYLTSPQLDSSPHESLADQLTRRVTGVRAEWGNSRTSVRLVSLRGPIRFTGQTKCFVQVYVDNNRAEGDDLAHIRSGDVAGIEFYSIAPPVQYSVNAPCGVLLVWTRR
jgi:hypothetical protein